VNNTSHFTDRVRLSLQNFFKFDPNAEPETIRLSVSRVITNDDFKGVEK
jgi:hypothetical protein